MSGQDTLINIGTSYGKFVVMQTFHDALIAMRALIWQGHMHFIQGWSQKSCGMRGTGIQTQIYQSVYRQASKRSRLHGRTSHQSKTDGQDVDP